MGLVAARRCVFLRGMHFCDCRKITPRRATVNGRFVVGLELGASFNGTARASRIRSAIDCTSVCTTLGRRVRLPSGLLRRMYKQVMGELFQSFQGVERVRVGLTGEGPPVKTSVSSTKMRVRYAQS